MVDSWLRSVNIGTLIGCVLVDFRKAFDLVNHKILLKINYNATGVMKHALIGLNPT